MSNVHGLYSNKDENGDDSDDENNRFVGGIGDRGGGSGLAVQPNNDDETERDSVFRLAQNASPDEGGEVRRTITMYRDGFVVDDGPYRRLDDPDNADFLRALAMGRTPRELMEDSESGNVVVGLVDKRGEEYVEQFRSFSGQGNSLGSVAAPTEPNSAFKPSSLPSSPPPVDANQPTTSIQVRLLNGQRRVIKINLSQTVADLAAHLREHAESQTFRLVSGFPPKPLEQSNDTVEAAGLKGAQVSMQKVN